MIKSQTSNMKHFYFLFTLLLILGSCKNNTAKSTEDSEQEEAAQEQEMEKKYTLTAFSPSPAFPEAQLTLEAYQNGKFDFTVTSETYTLGNQTEDAPQKMCANSDKGQHIHLIVDTDPYAAKYEADFDYEIPDGEKNILAFISRSYHESIKTATSYVALKATVENNSITSQENITEEMLFYSRPKGIYTGKKNTEKVMLDFFLVNSELGENRKVRADINGEAHIIDQWVPYYIEGLPIGKNSITLNLIDGEGNLIEAPGNPVTREFELKEDPAEEM